MATPETARKKPPRSTIALRWAGVAALAIVAFLYYPAAAQLPDHALGSRPAKRRGSRLRAEHDALTRRLTRSTSKEALERAARHLGLVRPGERLYIVKGINAWLAVHRSAAGSGPAWIRSRKDRESASYGERWMTAKSSRASSDVRRAPSGA